MSKAKAQVLRQRPTSQWTLQHGDSPLIYIWRVPDRGEIDETQELNYPAIMKAIIETGFKGHVAQEFVPKRPDVLASLKQGVNICDV